MTDYFIPHTQLEPIGETLPIDYSLEEDVFIVSYPKSGATWFQNLVAGLMYRVDPATTPDAVIQDLVPDVHYRTTYRRYGTRSFFKSHLLPTPTYRNVIYLLRDGRDVMVSYHHHMGVIEPPPQELRQFVVRKDLFPSPWHVHVEAWHDNEHQSRMVVIRYEELLSDPVGQLRRFCQFVGHDAETRLLEAVADRASFKNLRRKEARHGLANPRWPRDIHFFRRGECGSHQDEMSPEALRAIIKLAGPTLRRCGYLTDSDKIIRDLTAEVDHLESLLEKEREKNREAKARIHEELLERELQLKDLSSKLERLECENAEANAILEAIRRSVFTRILTSIGLWRVFR